MRNGWAPTGVHVNTGYNIRTTTGWHWKGNTDYQYVHPAGDRWYVYRQGHYCLTWPWLECFQNQYPASEAAVMSGGRYYSNRIWYR